LNKLENSFDGEGLGRELVKEITAWVRCKDANLEAEEPGNWALQTRMAEALLCVDAVGQIQEEIEELTAVELMGA
jgi:hypothetical protein